MSRADDDDAKEGEVLPHDDVDASDKTLNANILALIENHTDRPDLLIDAVERHDPGFVKRMNRRSEQFAEQYREARFRFGRFQAYSTHRFLLAMGLAIVALFSFAIVDRIMDFGIGIVMILFFAVIMSGPSGFAKIVSSIVKRRPPDRD